MAYRRAARTDANHAAIVAALRKIGCEVTDLSAVGGGVPDLLVSYRKQWLVVEVKDGAKAPSRRRLTADQERWHARQHAWVLVVESPEQAIQVVQLATTRIQDEPHEMA